MIVLITVSVPVLGIIFLSMQDLITIKGEKHGFRPRTGDYFFIKKGVEI